MVDLIKEHKMFENDNRIILIGFLSIILLILSLFLHLISDFLNGNDNWGSFITLLISLISLIFYLYFIISSIKIKGYLRTKNLIMISYIAVAIIIILTNYLTISITTG